MRNLPTDPIHILLYVFVILVLAYAVITIAEKI